MHRHPQNQRLYTSTCCACRSHACCSCPLSISQDTRVLFTARRWNSGRADKLTEHVSFKRMAIAMPENSAVLLPYPVPRTGCRGRGLKKSKDNRPNRAKRGESSTVATEPATVQDTGCWNSSLRPQDPGMCHQTACTTVTGHGSQQEDGARRPKAMLQSPAHPKSISPDRAWRLAATPPRAGPTCRCAGHF